MIVKWRTGGFRELIARVECVRETSKTVVVTDVSVWGGTKRERKALKHSDSWQYHDTWADAKAYLVTCARREVDAYKERLHSARSRLSQIESLKEPVEQAQEAAR